MSNILSETPNEPSQGTSNEETGMNHFDQLPDELVVRILRFLVDDLFKSGKSTQEKYETLYNICRTCKRFNNVINNKLFTIIDWIRLPTLRIGRRKLNPNKSLEYCKHTHANYCLCGPIRAGPKYKNLTYRCIIIHHLDLFQNCVVKAIEDERRKLESIVQLHIAYSKFDGIIIDKILTSLPNLERLFVGSIVDLNRLWTERATREKSFKPLGYLKFGFEKQADSFLEYLIDYVPAHIVDGTLDASHQEHLDSVRRYLLQHKTVIKHFGFKLLNINQLQIAETFQGFNYEIRKECEDLDEIISSSCPKSIADSLFVGGFKV